MSLKLKIPPPVVGLICALIMWMISRYFADFKFEFSLRILISISLLCLGLLIDVLALLNFKHANTTINPMKPDQSSALVITGIYCFTRNPMYLGLLLILCSWGFYLGNILSVLLLPIVVSYITVLQIIPEEKSLEKTFGDKYIEYKQKVRRWI